MSCVLRPMSPVLLHTQQSPSSTSPGQYIFYNWWIYTNISVSQSSTELRVRTHPCNLSFWWGTWGAEAGGSQIWGQPGQRSNALSQHLKEKRGEGWRTLLSSRASASHVRGPGFNPQHWGQKKRQMIPSIWDTQKQQYQRESKWNSECQELRDRKWGLIAFRGHTVSVLQDEKSAWR